MEFTQRLRTKDEQNTTLFAVMHKNNFLWGELNKNGNSMKNRAI